MVNPAERNENIRKLRELIKDIKFAMLTTVEDDSHVLRSRPMFTQDVEFDGDLWFFREADAPKVDDVEGWRHVNVSYADVGANTFVSVSGRAYLVRDREKLEEYWRPAYKAWFPHGLDDPNLALLRIEVTQAEYWDTPGSKVMHTLGFLKAAITGTEYNPGENEKLNLA